MKKYLLFVVLSLALVCTAQAGILRSLGHRMPKRVQKSGRKAGHALKPTVRATGNLARELGRLGKKIIY